MNAQTQSNYSIRSKRVLKALVTLGASLSLMGCYVEVYSDYEDDYHYEPSPYTIADMRTSFLVEAAITPVALAAEAPYQVIDPDEYTSPRSRMQSRAHVTDTTYAYLFDNVECAEGGSTQVEAEAETTSYSDGYTYVDIQTSAQANHCQVWQNSELVTINSDLSYDTTGWYDDYENELSRIDGQLGGQFNLKWHSKQIELVNISSTITEINATDFKIDLKASAKLDDGFSVQRPTLTTTQKVHWYLGAKHPHLGEMKFISGLHWVSLKFEEQGVWRENSQGRSNFWTWTELGY
ncbi:hypothetical protein KO489_03180 [Reinekea forsetii]|nr:hypothetical protein [Reinekea forsetii]